MTTIVEFPATIQRRTIEALLAAHASIQWEFQQTDNLHHKYMVTSKYADDFVMLGTFIGIAKA